MNRSKRSMGKGNGKTEGNLDLEHELPAAEGGEETPSTSSTASAREQQEFREYAAADVIKNILPVLDSFERALKASAGGSNDLRGGLELIYRQFQDTLQKLGVQPIESVGKPFDPRAHEAVEMVDTTEAPD